MYLGNGMTLMLVRYVIYMKKLTKIEKKNCIENVY